MSKIVQAVNAMISNRTLISNVIASEMETFFLYKGKYKWSMRRDDKGEYYLWYYPEPGSLEQLASFEGPDWEDVPMVVYKTSDIGTKEARASFAELHGILMERRYGVDDVLDDIIADA